MTSAKDGFNGAFRIILNGLPIDCIASDGEGWQHVSVKYTVKPGYPIPAPPSWSVMCQVKDLFWEPEDCVIEYYPPKSNYVNVNPSVLHLWRPLNQTIPMPPINMV